MIKSLYYIVPAAVAVSAWIAPRDTSTGASSNGMMGMPMNMDMPMNVANEAMGNAMNAVDMSMDTAMPEDRETQITGIFTSFFLE